MTKKISLAVLSIALVLSIAASISASTLITGKIYNSDYSDVIEGAIVDVTCNGNLVTVTSRVDGSYNVQYPETGIDSCKAENTLTVSASKGDLYGSKTGVIHSNVFDSSWDLAVVNVPLVPEFGFVAGMITIFGAVGLFFFVRRK